MSQFSRTELLFGNNAVEFLQKSFVAIFGIGGVGTFAVEALCRSGVGQFALFDDDRVCMSNLNRQLIATHKTIGINKTEAMRDRILEINPLAQVEMFNCFYNSETAEQINLKRYSYIIDAIDTVTAKLILIGRAKRAGVPIISCMGAGNKIEPSKFEVADIFNTSGCPLARVMRRELRDLDIKDLKVVYSREKAIKPIETESNDSCVDACIEPPERKGTYSRRQIPGSVSFVPSVVGLIAAGEVIKDLLKMNGILL